MDILRNSVVELSGDETVTKPNIESKGPAPTLDLAELCQAWGRIAVGSTNLMHSAIEKSGRFESVPFDMSVPAQAIGDVVAAIWRNPYSMWEAGQSAAADWIRLWQNSAAKLAGSDGDPFIAPDRSDRRFRDKSWEEQPVFDYLKQAYLLMSRQLRDLLDAAEGLDPATRVRAEFYIGQFLNALSPSNYPLTNPEAIRRAIDTGSVSLLSGLANLLDDASAGKLPVRRSNENFELGVNLAATEGSVIFQNELMQLIQYAPATKQVYRRPLLYVPPMVNKYYFLDLQPKSSLIRWLVEQGHSLFVISWVNPGPELADQTVEDYIRKGPLEALNLIEQITGERSVDLFGFCMGGTLAAISAAYLAANEDGDRVGSLTTIGTMLDFREMGEWATFMDASQVATINRHLEAKGVLDSADLQALFSVVRSNDLIWSSVINHYLLDQEAPPSDILFWFADGANIPAAFLSDYVDRVLRQNLLHKGEFTVGDSRIDFKAIDAPAFLVSLKDDHVSSWQATYDSTSLLGGDVRFLLGGSGHNAGVINPPSANKHGYWTSDHLPERAGDWMEGAERKEGSWWPEWQAWLASNQPAKKVPARTPGTGPLKEIEPAPGSYVRKR